MKRTLQALGVTVGIFLAIEVVFFIIGLVVLMTTQHADPNGITSTPDAGATASLNAWSSVVAVGGALLAVVGGVVFGVQRRNS